MKTVLITISNILVYIAIVIFVAGYDNSYGEYVDPLTLDRKLWEESYFILFNKSVRLSSAESIKKPTSLITFLRKEKYIKSSSKQPHWIPSFGSTPGCSLGSGDGKYIESYFFYSDEETMIKWSKSYPKLAKLFWSHVGTALEKCNKMPRFCVVFMWAPKDIASVTNETVLKKKLQEWNDYMDSCLFVFDKERCQINRWDESTN